MAELPRAETDAAGQAERAVLSVLSADPRCWSVRELYDACDRDISIATLMVTVARLTIAGVIAHPALGAYQATAEEAVA